VELNLAERRPELFADPEHGAKRTFANPEESMGEWEIIWKSYGNPWGKSLNI